jgi:hypothetical protein
MTPISQRLPFPADLEGFALARQAAALSFIVQFGINLFLYR